MARKLVVEASFVSQSMYNTKVLGIGDIFLYGFKTNLKLYEGVCYISKTSK